MVVIMSLPVQMRIRVELEGNQMRIATNNYSAKKKLALAVFSATHRCWKQEILVACAGCYAENLTALQMFKTSPPI